MPGLRRALALLGAFALIGAAPAGPPQFPTAVSATTPSGASLSLGADRRQVVVVHFWASWCAPCRVEMPMLDASWRRHQAEGLAMLGIALDAGASRKKIAAAAMGSAFPVARLADTSWSRRDVPRALPETRIYGRDGRLRYVFRAGGTMLDAKALEHILPPLLAER